jgi:hypothetical protein
MTWCSATTAAICIGSIVATATMFARVASAQHAVGFALMFGTWASLPYVGFIIANAVSIGRPYASAIILVGAALMSLFGLRSLHDSLSFFFAPLPPGAGQCAGPIVEMVVPLIQWLGFVVIGIAAWIAQLIVSQQ